jgi:phospholipid/cholesterol/gamma-HCH transport system substrate-binding protein
VSGLQIGNKVRFSGIDVGKVEDIAIISDTWVRVDMIINQSAQKFIRKDARAIISSEGLMGSKVIKIIAGQKSLKEIENGGLIETITPQSIDDVISKVSMTAENSANITENLAILTNKIKSGKGIVGKFLMDSDYSKDIGQSLSNIKKSTEDLAFITKQVKSGNNVFGKLFMDSVYGADIGKMISSLKRNSDTLSVITNNINWGINSGGSVINKLLMDSVYAKNMGEALVNVKQTTQGLKEIMPALRNNILFRGYFRKEKAANEKAQRDTAKKN